MISYQVYLLLHLLGVFALLVALGGVSLHALNGGTRAGALGRRMVAALHGSAAVIILVAGFGLLARIGFFEASLPGWVWGKLVVWLVLAAMIALPYRRPAYARAVLLLLPVLAGIAAWLAIFKPI